MRIFLDVGGHNGETLSVALNPKWEFDSVHSFEPSTSSYSILRKFRGKNLYIHNYGLGSKSETKNFYGAGTVGGSLYPNKNFADKNALNYVEEVKIIEASFWIEENTKPSDQIFLKMNCEGSEADILENLIETSTIFRIASIYVDFDVRKIPGQEFRQTLLENALESLNVSFTTPEKLKTKGEPAIEKWLHTELVAGKVGILKSFLFKFRLYLPTYLLLKLLILKLFPRNLSMLLVKNFGRLSKIEFNRN